MSKVKHILFFDGVCNLCNGAVDFFFKIDSKHVLRFAPLQGKTAQENLINEFTNDLNTVVLYTEEKIYVKSHAILKALSLIGYPYKLMIVFLLIPRFLTDFIYDLVAKNRYHFFGKKETCRLPSPAEKSYFLD